MSSWNCVFLKAWVCSTGAILFQASVGHTPGSFSMPARSESASSILQLGQCHSCAPGPKPYEAERISNTEEAISVVSFSSEPVSVQDCGIVLSVCPYLIFFFLTTEGNIFFFF